MVFIYKKGNTHVVPDIPPAPDTPDTVNHLQNTQNMHRPWFVHISLAHLPHFPTHCPLPINSTDSGNNCGVTN